MLIESTQLSPNNRKCHVTINPSTDNARMKLVITAKLLQSHLRDSETVAQVSLDLSPRQWRWMLKHLPAAFESVAKQIEEAREK